MKIAMTKKDKEYFLRMYIEPRLRSNDWLIENIEHLSGSSARKTEIIDVIKAHSKTTKDLGELVRDSQSMDKNVMPIYGIEVKD